MRAAVTALAPLIVDVSPHCPVAPAQWPALAADGRFCAAILKAGQGVHADRWAIPHARAILGTDLVLGLYWYLLAALDGAAQADRLADLCDELGTVAILPVVDVEGAGNEGATAEQVRACTTAFAARCRERLGRPPVLYAGEWLVERALRDRMGCEWLWFASYTATLSPARYEPLGFGVEQLLAWQYAGADGRGVHAALASYPRETPIGPADISALTLPGGVEALRRIVFAEQPSG